MALFLAPAGASFAGVGSVTSARDRNPEPNVFTTQLVARPKSIDLDGDGRKEKVWTFNGMLPGPEIRVTEGDIVEVLFKNRLPVPSSIHWHGVLLNNASDGTPVTQNDVPPGGSFRYRFRVGGPGIFWYHPHVRPSNQVFKGLYGSLIVTGRNERQLARLGVIPRRQETVVLSDVTACKAPGENDAATFPADPTLPWSGGPEFPGNPLPSTPRDLCERPIDGFGGFLETPLAAGSIPNVQPGRRCLEGIGPPCRVNMGQWVLTNGRVAAARAGTPQAPGALAPDVNPISLAPGEAIRLRLINAALFRYFRLRLTDASGAAVPLYRIGGETGLLNRVRLEGGVERGFDTEYDRGEIVIGPSERAEVVVVAQGAPGDVLTLWTRDYSHTGRGFALVPTVPVLHFRVADRDPHDFAISGRALLRTDPRVDRPVESLKSRRPTGRLIAPVTFADGRPGTDDHTIRLTNVIGPSIDDVMGGFDAGAAGDYRNVPFLLSSRYARVGDLLRLEVRNETGAHHVFHMHGFDFQPLRFRVGDRTVHRFRQTELFDSIDVPAGHSLDFKVLLQDRALEPDSPFDGGALGRWLLHCHIFPHSGLGMISELVVLPAQ